MRLRVAPRISLIVRLSGTLAERGIQPPVAGSLGQFSHTVVQCMCAQDYNSFVAQGMNRLGARDRQRVSEHRRQRDEK
jgi:hypothetical protein